jgi:WXG100 family type VII secretion target
MAGVFTTTAEEMTAFSGRITTVTEQLHKEISTLNSLIDEVAGSWKGDAAIAYHNLQRQWNDDANDLFRILGEIGGAIDATTKGYSTTEEDQRTRLRGVQGS